jgi:hypothetical protein
MRLVVKFGEKKRYSDWQYERDPDAIEAVYKKLNAVDEADAARRALGG